MFFRGNSIRQNLISNEKLYSCGIIDVYINALALAKFHFCNSVINTSSWLLMPTMNQR